MKRFIGMLLAMAGGAGALWGGYKALVGETSTVVAVTNDFSLSAMAVGLIGLAVCTVGVVWLRD
jgi:hypothetical protein